MFVPKNLISRRLSLCQIQATKFCRTRMSLSTFSFVRAFYRSVPYSRLFVATVFSVLPDTPGSSMERFDVDTIKKKGKAARCVSLPFSDAAASPPHVNTFNRANRQKRIPQNKVYTKQVSSAIKTILRTIFFLSQSIFDIFFF